MTTAKEVGPDFSPQTKQTLAKRASEVCSKPGCGQSTGGFNSDPTKATNLGQAAHIKGARPGLNNRFDPTVTNSQRADISNGIWLCGTHAHEIDIDQERFPVELLLRWKTEHELAMLDRRDSSPSALREIHATGGAIGSIIEHHGPGTGLDIIHDGKGPAERIRADGQSTGEIIRHTGGTGTAKRIRSVKGGSFED